MDAVNPVKPSRREKAAATRERMILAATEVFTETGYVGARMNDIADRAGVAVQTLYYTFSTKADLLTACIGYAVLGTERVAPPEQEFWRAVYSARSGRAAIAAFVRGNAAILHRAAALDAVIKAVPHDPDAVAIVAISDGQRRSSQRGIVAMLGEKTWLRPDLELETATDILVALCGTELYLVLKRSGWAADKYITWLTDTLAAQLLTRPGTRRGFPGGR